ncbi:MAG: macro domain-containing protein [Fimbriimonadales bacterium]
MILEGQGNLIAAECDALVNTVNTVGVMGKGVALQFKQAFPANFKEYEAACKRGEVQVGQMYVTRTGMLIPRLIINFPTKRHWKGNARLEDVRAGLKDLRRIVESEGVQSIAIPPLGCGLGGLRWGDVRPLIVDTFMHLDVEVTLFEPGHTPATEERMVRTVKPKLTEWRAALVALMDSYSELAFEATHLEAQKLMYFMEAAGESFKEHFAKGEYGPYDQGMRHALVGMEGHYLRGFGEGKRLDPVAVLPSAREETSHYLEDHPQTLQRLGRVKRLIAGFESPYGLELLATVHWVVTQEDSSAATDADKAVALAHAWNARKRRALRTEHLRIAWHRLRDEGWFETN